MWTYIKLVSENFRLPPLDDASWPAEANLRTIQSRHARLRLVCLFVLHGCPDLMNEPMCAQRWIDVRRS